MSYDTTSDHTSDTTSNIEIVHDMGPYIQLDMGPYIRLDIGPYIWLYVGPYIRHDILYDIQNLICQFLTN